MIRSAFLALSTALILVVLLGWQNLTSVGWSQLSGGWDELSTYYDREEVSFPGVITDETQISTLIPKMIQSNIGLVNSPYPQTQTESSRLTTSNRECEATKANLNKVSVFLRSNVFEPLAPIAAYYDRDAKLSPELALFFQDYGYGSQGLTTNAAGERTTVPVIDRPRKVVVAGGSVAFGMLLDDANTLASKLQDRDSERQYITLAVPQGSAEQVICNLTKVMPGYRGQVDELIYVYSERDLDSGKKYGAPEDVIAWLKNLALAESLSKVTVIYSPTIYNVAPQFTRYKGRISARIPKPDKERLRKIVAGAQFGWHDISEIMLDASKAQGTPLSVLNNFADDQNLSLQGMNTLVDKLKGPKVEPVLVSAAPQLPEQQQPPPPDPGVEKRIEKQSAALEDIRAAAGRAAKNNRLKREVGDILNRLKEELATEP